MKKSILMVGASLALAATMVVGGTLAYFSDAETKVNVSEASYVDIELNELQRNDEGTAFEAFEQGKTAMPLVYDGANKNEIGLNTNTNYIDKIVYATNTGDADAYVRIVVGIPTWATSHGDDDSSKNNLHWNYPGDANYGTDSQTPIQKQIEEQYNAVFGDAYNSWKLDYDMTHKVTVDGEDYWLFTFTFKDAIKPGESTDVVMTGFYLDKAVDYDPDTGKYLDVIGNPIEGFDGIIKIPVAVEAIQVVSSYKSAYDALTAEIGNTKDGTYNPFVEVAMPVVVDNAEDLVAALEADEDVVLTDDIKIDPASMSNAYGKTGINVKNGQTINGGNNTIDIKGAGGTWDSGINTTGGTIEDVTITGSFRGIFINHNSTHSEPVILNNVTIDGTTYTISCDQGTNQTLTATNCTFNGWTSYAKTLGEATFVDCSFGEGNGYAFCRPYAPTAFVNCDFEAGYEMDPRAAVTFENCTIGGVALTADNLATLVTSNIDNATVVK